MQEEDMILMEELNLNAWGAEMRGAYGKAVPIICSSLVKVSLVSSSILMWTMQRSNVRFSSIYHHTLLGMSISDIVLSLGHAHFNITVPSNEDYMMWNARGNQMTCSAQGFVQFVCVLLGLQRSWSFP